MKILKWFGLIILSILVIGVCIVAWYSFHASEGYRAKINAQAVARNDSKLCDKLVSDPTNNYPLSCHNNVAVQNNNLRACDKQGWVCFSAYFNAHPDKNPEMCDSIQDYDGQKDQCIVEQTRAVHDITLCELLTKENSRNICYGEMARYKKDPAICNTYIIDQNIRKICISIATQ